MSVRSRATEAASREAPLRLKYVLEVGSRNRALEEGPLDIGYAEIMNFAEMKFVVNNEASKGDAQKWKFYMKWALQEHMVNAASSPGAEYPMEIFDMRGDLVFTVFFKKKPEAGWEAEEYSHRQTSTDGNTVRVRGIKKLNGAYFIIQNTPPGRLLTHKPTKSVDVVIETVSGWAKSTRMLLQNHVIKVPFNYYPSEEDKNVYFNRWLDSFKRVERERAE